MTAQLFPESRPDLCALARRLAVEAGEAIMEVYAREDLGVETKADDSPVTAADLAANAIITAGLRAAYPQIPLVTEEEAETHAQGVGERFFLIDPLDGTKEFVQRRGEFTVNIALIEGGVPTLGVVYAPAIGRLFRTDAVGCAFEESGDIRPAAPGPARRISVRRPDNAALIVVASKSHRDRATDDYIARYRVAEFTSAGSSLKFCLLAAGEADLYPRLGRTMEWDTAAGQAVLLAAGGKIDRLDRPEPLSYGKAGCGNPFFIAYAKGVEIIR